MKHPTDSHLAGLDADAKAIASLDAERRAELICAYLDDELSPEAARHVTAWLDRNPEALREVEHLRRVWDVMELYEDEPVPEGFAGRVLQRVGLGSADVRSQRRWMAVGLVAVAASLLIAVGATVFALRGEGPGNLPPEGGSFVDVADVPPELLEHVDVILSLEDDEFHGLLLADLETP